MQYMINTLEFQELYDKSEQLKIEFDVPKIIMLDSTLSFKKVALLGLSSIIEVVTKNIHIEINCIKNDIIVNTKKILLGMLIKGEVNYINFSMLEFQIDFDEKEYDEIQIILNSDKIKSSNLKATLFYEKSYKRKPHQMPI